jgi:exodeoxyribonuclease V beta subunit
VRAGARFDLAGPLPAGRLAIEASAGTGKTYALSTLAARYVAEAGVAIGELLVVTFTRAAAAELKDRVRARLVEFAAALADDAPADATRPDGLPDGLDDVTRATWRARVATAVADFDAATVTTIHGFAQQVLGTLGSTVDTDPDAVLVDDADALIRQAATDLLTTEAVLDRHPDEAVPGFADLVAAAALAFGNPAARRIPSTDPAESTPDAARRRRLVEQLDASVRSRRRAAGTLSFDDLLVQLRDALERPGSGRAARRLLRERYRVALIDEFQDTDPVQWAIFDALFGRPTTPDEGPATTLVLVGDPKQAIYAFRGAEVHTYLQAAHSAGTSRASLGVNWRSDEHVLTALEALLSGATFGDERISFQPVEASEPARGRRLRDRGDDALASVSLRLAVGPEVPRQKNKSRRALVDAFASVVLPDLATHLRDLLETAVVPDEDVENGTRPLRPDDIAVLIAANWEAPLVRDALLQVQIPAVIARGDSVLESEAATQWHWLLAALERPSDARRVRAAALSWFVGWTAAEVAVADDTALGDLQERLHRWGQLLTERGVAAWRGVLWAETGVAARVLGRVDGDRAMTDLDHVGELLQLASGSRTSPTSLLDTFEQLHAGSASGDPDDDVSARRVESEARAVQIMTTFVAKGLEFPVVCCPSLWRQTGAKASANVYWDAGTGQRVVDVATDLTWPDQAGHDARHERADREAVGTNLRLLYVALTRARHHTALWWLPASGAERTGLARVLFARDEHGAIDAEQFTAPTVPAPVDETALDALTPLLLAGGDALAATVIDRPSTPARAWAGANPPAVEPLSAATLERELERVRGRWSFTAVTARGHDDRPAPGDPLDDSLGDAGAADEPAAVVPPPADVHVVPDPAAPPDPARPPMLLGDVEAGAGFGTLVHEVLERVDFAAPDLEDQLGAVLADRLAWNPWPVDERRVVDGLAAALRTPLGPLFAGRPLCELRAADHLDELRFELGLGTGGTAASDAAVGRLLLDHLGPTDPLHPWATQLAAGPFSAVLAGHLTGSVDLVARVRHDDGERFVVVDYKTNRLGPRDRPASLDDYHPSRLVPAMSAHHYPLQALLYAVALHRYLRWRRPGYDAGTHLGGVGYLFLRGLVGPDTPTTDGGVPFGLFSWQPPAALVEELSDLLDGTHRLAGGGG